MSIFDTIKYPISNPPKYEELIALPEDLLIDVLMEVNWLYDIDNEVERRKTMKLRLPGIIFDYTAGAFPKDIPVLRKMIRDYDEPI